MKKLVLVLTLFAMCAFGQNLLENGSMDSEEYWEVQYYNADELPEYEFGYEPAEEEMIARGGEGKALKVMLEDSPAGQLLLYQIIPCEAGVEYRATAAMRVLDYYSAFEPVNKGGWFQFYVSTELPDPDGGDYNPGDKMFDISAWNEDADLLDFERFNGYWESFFTGTQNSTVPYFTCPGEPGEVVDVCVGIKFGHWANEDEPGSFTVLVDNVGFYEVEANLLLNGGMETEDDWEVLYYNADEQPEYEFGYELEEGDSLAFGRDKCLHIWLDGQTGGQLLFYQEHTVKAGEIYKASGAIRVNEYVSDFEPVSQGPWYQYYVSTVLPDPNESDYNPNDKMFDISAWDEGCDMAAFEDFNGLWEAVACESQHDTWPYFYVPGEPGEAVDIAIGIKFGHWAPEPGYFDVIVDEIQFIPWGDADITAVEENAIAPQTFTLNQNYPNPFNPSTTISYTLDKTQHITLEVFDLLGHKITELHNGFQTSGEHHIQWNGTNDAGELVASGLYLYKLSSNNSSETRKMMFLK